MSRLDENKKNKYLDELFCLEDPIFEKIQNLAKKSNAYHMQISPHEGRILYFLARMISAKKIVEIGTLFAYSTLHLAKAMPEDGMIFTCDISKENHKKAQEILKESRECKKIKWIHGEATKSLKTLEALGPFDLVFIDADKINYGIYLEWAEKNLRKGGLVIGDNSFLFGSVYGEDERDNINSDSVEVMKSFNQRIANLDGICIPTIEGLSLAIKK